jgi:dihydroorotate dehydrogenase
MITLRNGHSFEYMTASGAMGFSGQGWPWEAPFRWIGLLDPTQFTVVIKTLTWEPRVGNGMKSVRILDRGTVNAVGLTNPGFRKWVSKYGWKLDPRINPIVSILGTPDEIEEMIADIRQLYNAGIIKGIEVNGSCPNFCKMNDDDIIEGCQRFSKHEPDVPVILKVGAGQDYLTIVKKAAPYIDAVSINSVPWRILYPDKVSPLEHLGGGGVSGGEAQRINWTIIKDLVKLDKIPIIGCSVWANHDLPDLRAIGAKAISFGAIFMTTPWVPNAMIKRDKEIRALEKEALNT